MRWSDRSEDNLEALLRDADTKLGAALTELREHKTEPSAALRERVRTITSEPEERAWRPEAKPPLLRRYRFSVAHAAVIAVAFVGLTAVMGAIKAAGDGDEPSGVIAGPMATPDQVARARRAETRTDATGEAGGGGGGSNLRSAAPPPAAAESGSASLPRRRAAPDKAAPLPSTTRAQDYSADIKLHVADHDELSDAVQSAIRTTRQLGGSVTYVDYGTSGEKDGEATLAVRVPVGRVQAAVARFSQLGTILEQQTEVVDLQGRIDKITRNIQQRRDRLAKLEAQLKDPTLSDAERNRLEARVVQAKRGLANAQRARAGVIRQSRYATLDLAFTTEKRNEPAPPPSELRKTLDDALGILAAELGVLLYVLIAGAPFILLGLVAWFGARAARRASGRRVLERA
jgi:hypothetical protein